MVQENPKHETTDVALPDKKYFKIGETSSLLGVKPHVLRYWETEFPQIRPYKSKTGQRLYRKRDVEALLKIQRLLYQERFTIAGARQALRLGSWVSAEDERLEEDSVMPEQMEPEIEPMTRINPMIRISLLAAQKELETLLQIVNG